MLADGVPGSGRTPAVLLVLAREPCGRSTGRKAVLATAVRGLAAAGVQVHVLAVTVEKGSERWHGCTVERVAPPGVLQTAVSALASVVTKASFNEALFRSRRVRRSALALARRSGADAVLADTVRAWDAATATGLPVVAHLDDLLSERYARLAQSPTGGSVLGYYGDHLPAPARRVAEAVARRLLSVEAHRQRRREAHVARAAAVTALTAASEADELSRRTGVKIRALPMAVDPVDPANPADAPAGSAVFVGGLDYGPNVEALRWWCQQVMPLLYARGRPVGLTVVGHVTPRDRAEFSCPQVVLRGYVPDLAAALRGHRMFVAPVRSGAGVKTKVLDAMSVGLPVVTTSEGLAGVPAEHGRHALVADDAAAFADSVVGLADDAERAARLGRAGRELLSATFGTARLAKAWNEAFADALAKPGPA